MHYRLLPVLLTLFAAACSGHLAEKPSRHVDFSGHWALNVGASDDPQRLLVQDRERMRAVERRSMDPADEGRTFHVNLYQARSDMIRRLFDAFSLNARKLIITQTEQALAISDGDLSNDYVYGEKSVVSLLSGAADRRVGWEGEGLVVQTQSPDGPGAVQTFKLSPDGRELILATKLQVGGGELAIKRVFDRE